MKNIINRSAIFILFITVFISCTKQKAENLADVRPAVPVTVQNAFAYRPDPTVTTSKSGSGAIQIVLSIPSTSGRTIKEITKVAASTTFTQIQSSATTGFYNTAPIAGSGTTATFNTSLTEYFVKKPVVASSNPAAASNTELGNRFYFLVTLDDGSTIVTTPVRVLVLD